MEIKSPLQISSQYLGSNPSSVTLPGDSSTSENDSQSLRCTVSFTIMCEDAAQNPPSESLAAVGQPNLTTSSTPHGPPPTTLTRHISQDQLQSLDQSVTIQSSSQPEASSNSDQGTTSHLLKVSPVDILEALEALAQCLNPTTIKYAIAGGASLLALGSCRCPADVDFVIYPPTAVKAAKTALQKDSRFTIEPRTRHTTFRSNSGAFIDIQALSSLGTFKARFDDSTELIATEQGFNLLPASLYLENKCRSLPLSMTNNKKLSDAEDIVFLLRYMIGQNIQTNIKEVPSAPQASINWFNSFVPGSRALFQQVGL